MADATKQNGVLVLGTGTLGLSPLLIILLSFSSWQCKLTFVIPRSRILREEIEKPLFRFYLE